MVKDVVRAPSVWGGSLLSLFQEKKTGITEKKSACIDHQGFSIKYNEIKSCSLGNFVVQ